MERICARDLRPGAVVVLRSGAVKVLEVYTERGGIEATVRDVRARNMEKGRRVLWFWPQEGINVRGAYDRQIQEIGPRPARPPPPRRRAA